MFSLVISTIKIFGKLLQYLYLDSKIIIHFIFYYSFFSGDISLDPGPFSNPQLFKQEEWQGFIHLNMNSLLPKIDKLTDIVKKTKAAVIDISESKHDSTVLDPEIYIENYKILRFERNRHGKDIACYIRIDISIN